MSRFRISPPGLRTLFLSISWLLPTFLLPSSFFPLLLYFILFYFVFFLLRRSSFWLIYGVHYLPVRVKGQPWPLALVLYCFIVWLAASFHTIFIIFIFLFIERNGGARWLARRTTCFSDFRAWRALEGTRGVWVMRWVMLPAAGLLATFVATRLPVCATYLLFHPLANHSLSTHPVRSSTNWIYFLVFPVPSDSDSNLDSDWYSIGSG